MKIGRSSCVSVGCRHLPSVPDKTHPKARPPTDMNLSREEKRRHIYIAGKTGTGKSTLLRSLMARDEGFALLDPHGDLAEAVADTLPPERTVYLDPLDPTHAVGFNPLARVPVPERALATAAVLGSLKAIWAESWGPRLEYILGNALRLLIDVDGTLLHLPLLLTDARFRQRVLDAATDPFNRYFWTQEYARYADRFRMEAIAPIQNKIGQLVANPSLRAILGQPSTFSPDTIMDQGGFFIANLSKRMGTEPSHLLGALLASAFFQAAERRATVPESERRDFTLYVDEFQNFGTEAFGAILSEARKWGLSLVVANQFTGQLAPSLKQAVFGNAGTLVAFRVGHEDAVHLAAEIGFRNPAALTDLPNFEAWVRRLRGGIPGEPEQLKTVPLAIEGGRLAAVIRHTRARHARPRDDQEQRFAKLYA